MVYRSVGEADMFAGRKSDPVEIPHLLLGEDGIRVLQGFCPWELQHNTIATFCTAGPEISGRQEGGQADKSHVDARSSDLQGMAWAVARIYYKATIRNVEMISTLFTKL